MSRRGNGGRFGNSNNPNTSTASGIWTIFEQGLSKISNIWPAAATVPGTPTSVSVATGVGQAVVSFTEPASGGAPITQYTVTSNPGGITATGSSSPITITGLTNGTSYTFTVIATNDVGNSPASSPTSSVTIGAASVEYLVVAGGGGGGGNSISGGGGAGGLLNGTQDFPFSTAYSLRVGAGGNGGPNGNYGTNGSNSILGSLTAIGGGYGSTAGGTANPGGSGGGSSANANYGNGTPGQGNRGGNAYGAGGGGAGATGTDRLDYNGSTAGGVGLEISITGTPTFYAGGGGAGGWCAKWGAGAGGNGGGGPGGDNAGTAGTANRGGGGGGGGYCYGNGSSGGPGGSGVVIIKIPNTRTATFSGGVTSSLSTAVSGFKIYTVTATSTTSETVTFS